MSSDLPKPDQYDEFMKQAHNWTLKQDIELKDVLRGSAAGILDAIKKFELTGDELEKTMELLEIRLENIHNRIGCVKMERLVEEHVDEISSNVLDRRKENVTKAQQQKSTREEYERRTIGAITNAVQRGFELLDSVQDEQQQSSSVLMFDGDPLDPSSSSNSNSPLQQPKIRTKKAYDLAELLPLIGSPEFYSTLKKELRKITDEAKREVAHENAKAEDRRSVTPSTKLAEEDVASVSSSRSAPPQDPIAEKPTAAVVQREGEAGLTMRAALLEELVGRAEKREGQQEQQETVKSTPPPPPPPQHAAPLIASGRRDGQSRQFAEEIVKSQVAFSSLSTQQGITAERQEKVEKTRRKRTERTNNKKRSLFSSSSDTDENEEVFESSTRTLRSEQRILEKKTVAKSPTSMEKAANTKDQLPPHNQLPPQFEEQHIPPQDADDNDDMSKPVFKPFDASFSDRLTAVIQNGPVAFRSNSSISRRPFSAHSIPSGDEAAEQQTDPIRPLRKTESAISSNEELGPATVKARIAQIGAQIPIRGTNNNRRRAEDDARGDDADKDGRRTSDNRCQEEPKPMKNEMAAPLSETVKTRAKGPARRAPTQLGRLPPAATQTSEQQQQPPLTSSSGRLPPRPNARTASVIEQQQQQEGKRPPPPTNFEKTNALGKESALQKTPPETMPKLKALPEQVPKAKAIIAERRAPPPKSKVPPPPVKQKSGHSIFSSSSSDDDLGFSGSRSSGAIAGGIALGLGVTKTTTAVSKMEPRKTTTTTEQYKQQQQKKAPAAPPFSYKKTEPAKVRKGLFDDSESDF